MFAKSPASFFACITALLLLTSGALAELVSIHGLETRQTEDRTRLVFEMNKPPVYAYDHQQDNHKLVLTFQSTRLATSIPERLNSRSFIKNITRTIDRAAGSLTLSLTLASAVVPTFSTLPPVGDYQHRLLVDLAKPSAARGLTGKQPKPDDIIVVIDAGHGGRDPGATANGQEEKNITLAIASYMANELDKIAGIRGMMTRSQDVFLGLTERVRIARALKADFFVSIHADAFIHPRAFGASVYVRADESGASSEAAAWLASQANSNALSFGDHMGVLAGMSAQASMATALDYGDVLLDALGTVTHLHSKRVERGDFTVLNAPDIPSVLIETGFISNPSEAKLLSSDKYRKKLAKQIVGALTTFIRQQPSFATWALTKPLTRPPYTVARGDTLSEIARAFDVSSDAIIRYNGLSDANKIRVGDVLLIP